MRAAESDGFLSFKAVSEARTYLSILYHLISLPLGVFYFVFIVTCLSLGLGLAVFFIGLLALMGLLAAVQALAGFERVLASSLLGAEIAPQPPLEKPVGLWKRLSSLASSPATWKALVYLFLRFPLGIFSFSLTVALISTSISLIGAPLLYTLPGAIDWHWGYWTFSSPFQLMLLMILGLIIGFLSLHLLRGLARLFARLAEAMLGGRNR